MITYNNIITALNNFADNHFFIKAFSHGDADEMLLEKYQNFPLMHVFYTGSNYNEGQKEYSFEIYIVDLPADKEDKVSYQKEVVSDSEQCAEDLLADLSNGFNIFNEEFLFDTESASISPVIEESSQVISGVVLDISISVPYQHDSCNAPLLGVIPTPDVGGDCKNATYKNSDGTYVQIIGNGQTFTSNDITITDVDGVARQIPSNEDAVCVWTQIAVKNSAGTTIIELISFPVGAEAIIPNIIFTDWDGATSSVPSGIDISASTPPPSKYKNSSGTFIVELNPGDIETAPDISINQVNGDVNSMPANEDVTCVWTSINVVNSVAAILESALSFPVGAEILISDITFTDSDGAVSQVPAGQNITASPCADATIDKSDRGGGSSLVTTVPSGGTFDISLLNIVDQNDVLQEVIEYGDTVKIEADAADITISVVASEISVQVAGGATPSGTHYQHLYPTQRTSYITGDTGWHVQNGSYDYTPPAYPAIQACIDPNAQQSGVRATPASGTSSTDSVFPTMMVNDTVDGSKFRFVDDQGNPSDATVGSNIWAHVDWNGHSWAGCNNPGLVYDHLFGIWMDVDYLTDGALYNQNTTNGQGWSSWMTYINGATHKGSSDWLPVNADMFGYSAYGARHRWEEWALNFFNAQRSDNRHLLLTGDTPEDSTSNAILLGNYSNSTYMIQRQTKSTTTSFNQTLTNVFIFRIDRR